MYIHFTLKQNIVFTYLKVITFTDVINIDLSKKLLYGKGYGSGTICFCPTIAWFWVFLCINLRPKSSNKCLYHGCHNAFLATFWQPTGIRLIANNCLIAPDTPDVSIEYPAHGHCAFISSKKSSIIWEIVSITSCHILVPTIHLYLHLLLGSCFILLPKKSFTMEFYKSRVNMQ